MAKKGLPKTYIKQAGGDFKKAWRLYKKAKSGVKSGVKKATTTIKKGASTMAKNQKIRTVYKKTMPMSKEVLSGATTAMSVLGSNLIVNKIPGIKDLDPKVKAGAQIITGAVIAGMSKRKALKWVGAGTVIAGILNLSKEFEITEGLAGAEDSPTLSPNEMALLTEDRSALLGKPATVSGAGIPAKRYTAMGIPASVMSGNKTASGWEVK